MTNTKKNRKSFYFILLISPIVLLLLLELLLRIFGFGNSYPLFIPAKSSSGYLQPNPSVIKRYFSNPKLAPDIQPDTFFFRSKKPNNSFRIVIQGGSTAAGFPFGRFGSLHGMLQQRFKRLYPEKDIEIISTAMSAVNSYTLLDFTDEIVAIEPDLVLIYAGHNEFVGIMGVGSSYSVKNNRSATLVFLKIKELRLFQLMQSVVSFFQQDEPNDSQENNGHSKPDNRTLMAKISKEKEIYLNSELYQRGVEQFDNNLSLILSRYQQADIPVMISTLARNEKDQPPFSSSNGEFSASGYFNKAREFQRLGNFGKALIAYKQAADRDLLRFRAPSYFNQIIKKQASSHNAILVDGENALRKKSSDGIIGFQHMFEHLHPNARGYFLLAEAFADKIINKHLIAGIPNKFPSDRAWQDIPLTPSDLIAASFKIKTLTSDYPFVDKKLEVKFGKAKNFEEKMALQQLAGKDWLLRHKEMLEHYQKSKQPKLAARIAGLIVDAFPEQAKAAWVAGQLYFEIGDKPMALYYHRRALSLSPINIQYLLSVARSFYINGRKRDAIEILERVLVIKPKNNVAVTQKRRIEAELK